MRTDAEIARWMDYLYGEMTPEAREAYEAYLQAQPDLRRELEGLQEVRHTLQEWQEVQPPAAVLSFERNHHHSVRNSWTRWWPRLAAAAGILGLILTFSQVRIQKQDSGFLIAFGSNNFENQTTTQSAPENIAQEAPWQQLLQEESLARKQALDSLEQKMAGYFMDRQIAFQADMKAYLNQQSKQMQTWSREQQQAAMIQLVGLLQEKQYQQQESLESLFQQVLYNLEMVRRQDLQRIDQAFNDMYLQVSNRQSGPGE